MIETLRAAARVVHRRGIYPVLAGLLPADCFVCERPLGPVHLLGACTGCWAALRPIRAPCCPSCGAPHPPGTDLLEVAGGRCTSCVLRPACVEIVRAAVLYDDVARRFLLRAKFGRRPELLHHLGRQLARTSSLSIAGEGCTWITAVPSHPRAWWSRGFNPAAELARPVARELCLPVKRLLRRRWRDAASAKRMTASARRRVLRNAFVARRALSGERVLLIDDVLTTGATANHCAAALRDAGASTVRVAVWARTPATG